MEIRKTFFDGTYVTHQGYLAGLGTYKLFASAKKNGGKCWTSDIGKPIICSKDGKHVEKVKTIILTIWFIFVSLISPLWIGGIYMNITGHGKGYAYDMGSEADIAVLLGVVLLLLWLLAILPVTILLCKKCYHKKKSSIWLPFLVFAGLFAVGICILGWNEFIKLFGCG